MDDFTDMDMEGWSMTSDDLENFYGDVQRRSTTNGRNLDALRILEAGTSGTVDVRSKTFPLTGGTKYELTLFGMVDPRSSGWKHDDFEGIEIGIANDQGDVFRYVLGSALPLGSDWYRWEWPFTVDEFSEGDYWVSILVTASGSEVDWYFTQISVEQINS
jgi:hypothetical protein